MLLERWLYAHYLSIFTLSIKRWYDWRQYFDRFDDSPLGSLFIRLSLTLNKLKHVFKIFQHFFMLWWLYTEMRCLSSSLCNFMNLLFNTFFFFLYHSYFFKYFDIVVCKFCCRSLIYPVINSFLALKDRAWFGRIGSWFSSMIISSLFMQYMLRKLRTIYCLRFNLSLRDQFMIEILSDCSRNVCMINRFRLWLRWPLGLCWVNQ